MKACNPFLDDIQVQLILSYRLSFSHKIVLFFSCALVSTALFLIAILVFIAHQVAHELLIEVLLARLELRLRLGGTLSTLLFFLFFLDLLVIDRSH